MMVLFFRNRSQDYNACFTATHRTVGVYIFSNTFTHSVITKCEVFQLEQFTTNGQITTLLNRLQFVGDKPGMLPLTINVGQIKVIDKAGD
jgi:hypothetical protein